ncbi:hypothetical protein GOB57_24445 [Sinorhizobium meliloti]|nr:hypothetical protein [Sinorhizobium meliloti]
MESADIYSRLKLVARGDISPSEAAKVVREAFKSEDQRAINSAFTAVRERTWMYVKRSSPIEAARLWLHAIQHLSTLLLEIGETSLAKRMRGMSELLLQELRFVDLQTASTEIRANAEADKIMDAVAQMREAEGTLADPKWVEQIDADVDYLERMAEHATKGLYVAMDCRHLTAPADCVDYAVVAADAGREVSRVWAEDDARFQAAASPVRISRLVTSHRQLRAENAALKSGSRDGGNWIASLLRENSMPDATATENASKA